MKKLLEYMDEVPDDFERIKNTILEGTPFTLNQIQVLKNSYPAFLVNDMMTLIGLQKKNLDKLPFATKWLICEKSIQQASHFKLAMYHALLFREFESVADLCCGIGADLLYLSKGKKLCYAVDSDPIVLRMCQYNMSVFQKKNICFQNIKAQDFYADCEAVYIDPDRRKQNKRLHRLEDLSPSYRSMVGIIDRYKNVAIKLSPLLDYENELYRDFSFDFVSWNDSLKECLLKFGSLKTGKRAVLLSTNTIFTEHKHPDTEIKSVNKWLCEPDPAITRLHLVNDLAFELHMYRLDPNISLLTSDIKPTGLYGKVYEVVEVFPYNLKTLNNYLKANEIGILDIKTKGFSDTVERFRKKLVLKGKKSAVIFILRIGEKHICIVAKRCCQLVV